MAALERKASAAHAAGTVARLMVVGARCGETSRLAAESARSVAAMLMSELLPPGLRGCTSPLRAIALAAWVLSLRTISRTPSPSWFGLAVSLAPPANKPPLSSPGILCLVCESKEGRSQQPCLIPSIESVSVNLQKIEEKTGGY